VDEIVVAVDDRRTSFPIDDLLDCRMKGIDVRDVPTFLERETGKISLELITPSWLIFSDGFRRSTLSVYTKTAFDMAASSVLFLLTLPVMILTAIAIKLDNGWKAHVLYRQVRVGQAEKHFEIYKFRSMVANAESNGQAQWAEINDPRVTRVGAIIRKFRIDELPQIINVLRGEMSFVGPRPERPEFVETLRKKFPYYSERHHVKPGIQRFG
jgi:lipopolysaccharide/colanic/teichoic acid biosynthesis glycosyltransferase